MRQITCVVENSVRPSTPFWGEHGLAFLIETDDGCVLFDTGRSEPVLTHNLACLERSPQEITALALSHAHNDHTGGLTAILSQNRTSSLPLYANPDIFRPRYSHLPSGEIKPLGLTLTEAELRQGFDLRLNAAPVEVLPGLWTTGEITNRSEPEGRSPHHKVTKGKKGWQPDPYRDDLSLVLETDAGLVLICGCCHAGLLNTLTHVGRHFKAPVTAIVGGTHLVSADMAQLQRIIEVLRSEYRTLDFYVNHCTGERAFLVLAKIFGDRLHSCPAGTMVSFD